MTTDPSTGRPHRIYAGDSFGAALAHFREEAGLTQGALADRIGVTRQYINELEVGPPTERLERLVRAFHELGVRIKIGREEW
jgi:transcriptional regulator with XRE-family HTH domain